MPAVGECGGAESHLGRLLTQKPSAHWLELFNRTGIPSAPINDIEQAIHDPQVQHRQIVLPWRMRSVAPWP